MQELSERRGPAPRGAEPSRPDTHSPPPPALAPAVLLPVLAPSGRRPTSGSGGRSTASAEPDGGPCPPVLIGLVGAGPRVGALRSAARAARPAYDAPALPRSNAALVATSAVLLAAASPSSAAKRGGVPRVHGGGLRGLHALPRLLPHPTTPRPARCRSRAEAGSVPFTSTLLFSQSSWRRRSCRWRRRRSTRPGPSASTGTAASRAGTPSVRLYVSVSGVLISWLLYDLFQEALG